MAKLCRPQHIPLIAMGTAWPEHTQRLGQAQIRVPNVWPHGFRQTLPNHMITAAPQMSEYQQSAPGDSDRVDCTDKVLVFPIDVYLGNSAGMESIDARTWPGSE